MASSTFLFLLCFLIKFLNAVDVTVQLQRNEIQIFRSDHRDKRETRFGINDDDGFDPPNKNTVVLDLPDPNGCVLGCFGKLFDSLPSKTKAVVNLNEDPAKLQDFCNNIFPTFCVTDGCLKACPPSTIRSLFLDLQLHDNLMCQPFQNNEHFDLISTVSCYQRAKENIADQCDIACLDATTDKILPVLNNTVRVRPEVQRNPTEIKVTYESKNVTENTETMRGLCAWDTCYIKCSERILRNDCGLETAQFIENIKRGSTTMLLKMLREVDAVGSYIPECQAMIMNSTEVAAVQCSGKAGMTNGINAIVIVVLLVFWQLFS